MSEEKDTKSTSNSRRKALKAIGVGGVLAGTIPSSWTKPVVKSVILPAHAQTSQPEPPAPGCGSGGPCTSGMNVNILTAVINTPSGDLFVVGDTPIPDACTTTGTDTLQCDVIDNGVVLINTNRESDRSIPGSCTAGGTCLVSCSFLVPAASHSLVSGSCVTMRVTYNGNCVCSGVTTVS